MTLELAFSHSFQDRRFDIAIVAPTPGVTALFGPSGAGKSTIAAVVMGLLRPAKCRLVLDGEVLADSATKTFVPPERRRIGVVFQDSRLFPHLTVGGNLRYGLRRARSGAIGWDEVVALLGIGELLGRRPATLSGGEKQRVAIGRALLSQPRMLVMDEPLASLDTQRRREILPYLARLRESLALPILYITHAVEELARLADTLVLVETGRCIGCGSIDAMLSRTDLPIAARDDAGAVLACRVAAHLPERRLSRLAITGAPGLDLWVPLSQLPIGKDVRVRVPAGEVILATEPPRGISIHNALPARIVAITAQETALVEMRLGNAPFLARVTSDAVDRLRLAVGGNVLALVKSVSVQVLG